MARISLQLIEALRHAATKLESNPQYQWGHMGLCNCGFVAQEVTKLSKSEIHQRAMQQSGDWTEQLNDYCPNSGLPMDSVIDTLIDFGFDADDLKHLERLSDPAVLQRLPLEKRGLQYNVKRDVLLYFQIWIGLLEDQWAANVALPELHHEAVTV